MLRGVRKSPTDRCREDEAESFSPSNPYSNFHTNLSYQWSKVPKDILALIGTFSDVNSLINLARVDSLSHQVTMLHRLWLPHATSPIAYELPYEFRSEQEQAHDQPPMWQQYEPGRPPREYYISRHRAVCNIHRAAQKRLTNEAKNIDASSRTYAAYCIFDLLEYPIILISVAVVQAIMLTQTTPEGDLPWILWIPFVFLFCYLTLSGGLFYYKRFGSGRGEVGFLRSDYGIACDAAMKKLVSKLVQYSRLRVLLILASGLIVSGTGVWSWVSFVSNPVGKFSYGMIFVSLGLLLYNTQQAMYFLMMELTWAHLAIFFDCNDPVVTGSEEDLLSLVSKPPFRVRMRTLQQCVHLGTLAVQLFIARQQGLHRYVKFPDFNPSGKRCFFFYCILLVVSFVCTRLHLPVPLLNVPYTDTLCQNLFALVNFLLATSMVIANFSEYALDRLDQRQALFENECIVAEIVAKERKCTIAGVFLLPDHLHPRHLLVAANTQSADGRNEEVKG